MDLGRYEMEHDLTSSLSTVVVKEKRKFMDLYCMFREYKTAIPESKYDQIFLPNK